MCGRFLLTEDLSALKIRYAIPDEETVLYAPSPEIFPSQRIPVIYRVEHRNHLEMMDWGFPKPYEKGLLINARGETAASKPTFRKPFMEGRCLIPANGFFEWKSDEGRKVKFRIRRQDGHIFSMAGLWKTASDPKGSPANPVCVIITTAPTSWMAEIHKRMPVILDEETENMWLDPDQKDPEFLTSLLKPFDPEGSVLIAEKV